MEPKQIIKKIKTETGSPQGFGSSSGCRVSPRATSQHSDTTKDQQADFPSGQGLLLTREQFHPAGEGSVGASLSVEAPYPLPAGPCPSLECGDVVTNVQGKNQRHTLSSAVS